MDCQNSNCRNHQSWFRKRIAKKPGYYMESHWYCSEPCLYAGILHRLEKTTRPREKSCLTSNRARFGFFLLQYGVITKEQLDLAVAEQQKDNENHAKGTEERLGHYLQNMGYVKERDITMALSRQFSLPVISVINSKLNPKALAMVPAAIIQKLKFVPLDYDATSNSLSMVTYDPCGIPAMINLRGILSCDLSIYLGDESVVRELIQQACEEDEGNPAMSEFRSDDLCHLSGAIVERAQWLNARSLNVGYFDPLVWTRFYKDGQPADYILEHVIAGKLRAMEVRLHY